MRGRVSKESTSPNLPTKEPLVHIVSDNSPPHIEYQNIPKTTNEECKVEANKNQSEATTGQLDTSIGENERVSKLVYSNTSLIPYKSTFLIDLVGKLWREQRKRKRSHEKGSEIVTLQQLLF